MAQDPKPVELTGSNVPDTQPLPVKLTTGTTTATIINAGDGVALSNYNGLVVNAAMKVQSGEVLRNNTEGTLMASAARTATSSSSNQINYNAKGVLIFFRISASSGTGGLTPKIRAVDPTGGSVVQINPSLGAPISAIGTYGILVYPGISNTLNGNAGWVIQHVSTVLPRQWYLYMEHADGSSYTYSVGHSLIV